MSMLDWINGQEAFKIRRRIAANEQNVSGEKNDLDN
jgi:hypothetical protein